MIAISAIIDKDTIDLEDIGYFKLMSHLVARLKRFQLLFLTVGYKHYPPDNNEFDLNVNYETLRAESLPLYDDPDSHSFNLGPIQVRVEGLRQQRVTAQYLELTDKSNDGFMVLEKYVLPFFAHKDQWNLRWRPVSSWKLVPYNPEQTFGEHQPRLCSGAIKNIQHIHYCVSKEADVKWLAQPTCEFSLPNGDRACFWIHDADLRSHPEIPRTENSPIDFRMETK